MTSPPPTAPVPDRAPPPEPAPPAESVRPAEPAVASTAADVGVTPAARPGAVVIRWAWVFLDTRAADAARSWRFWSEATGWAFSPTRGEHDEFATLLPARGDAWVKLQVLAEGPGRVHLDLDVEDVEVAASRAEALGAVRTGALGDTVVILRSPGGFTFCLTAWQGETRQVREGAVELLDQVCLDIPGAWFDTEVAFWRDLTGWRSRPGRLPEFSYLERPGGIPFRLLLQRLGEVDSGGDTDGVVGAHVDFASADRGASTARHVGLGARLVHEGKFWTVLCDPVGRVYCLTDRDPVDPPGTAPSGG
ncbi:MAG: VOC family protein [Dermatophilaceae bacterium]